MAPKLSLRPLASLCRSCVTTHQSKAFLSSANGPKAAPRYTNTNATSDLLDIDSSTRPGGGGLDRSEASSGSNKKLEALTRILSNTNAMSGVSENKIQTQAKAKEQEKREKMGHWSPRRWKAGDVYAPHDMTPAEVMEWKQIRRPEKDLIDILGINPLDHYKNFSIISEYMSDMGRIKPGRMTGLRPVNQRKIAKAIRRAVGMGIHPSTHKHPMLLYSPEDLKNYADLRAIAARKAAEEEKTS